MGIQIIDVHPPTSPSTQSLDTNIRQQIISGLTATPKTLPTLLLYDTRGLRLYDDITTDASEYYLFGAEENILREHAAEIVQCMGDGTILELGSGSLRKTSHILRALPKGSSYYALDLEKAELERTLNGNTEDGVEMKGLWGTYDDGLRWLQTQRQDSDHTPLHMLFLGSSIGNFDRKGQAEFLSGLPLREGDTLLLGLDHDNNCDVIRRAYNDKLGKTTQFIMNGLKGAGRALGDEDLFFREGSWEYVNEYDSKIRAHRAYYKSTRAQTIGGFDFAQDELVKIEESYKSSDEDAYTLFTQSNLRVIQRWTSTGDGYGYSLWLLERPALVLASSSQGKGNVPTLAEWTSAWALWDYITTRMIPKEMLFTKPIDLRHIILFYLGHIPTFLDIHLTRYLGDDGDPDRKAFHQIFERGIDPDVDDPTQCHPHSEVPTQDSDWPAMERILSFQKRVRDRVRNVYQSPNGIGDRRLARILFMTFEHELFHAETLLYMMLQASTTEIVGGAKGVVNGHVKPHTIAPPAFHVPPFKSLAKQWDGEYAHYYSLPVQQRSVELEGQEVFVGHWDDEAEDKDGKDVLDHEYGWDNEHPRRSLSFIEEKVRMMWRPITNGEFYDFWKERSTIPKMNGHAVNGCGGEKGKENITFPASWIRIEGEVHVRTFYGSLPLSIARHWPVLTSYQNLEAYARSQVLKGPNGEEIKGRLPSEAELRLFMDKYDIGYDGGANTGFRNWHPVPATTGPEPEHTHSYPRSSPALNGYVNGTAKVNGHGPAIGAQAMKGHNGSTWEWTSTAFDSHPGFKPSELYPGYSRDFFDGRHYVVLGSAPITHPHLAQRRSLRNWYQGAYEYAWVGGRVCWGIGCVAK